MRKKIIIISISSLVLIGVALVILAINWNTYDFFICRLERHLEDKFEITKLDDQKYEECADRGEILPYDFPPPGNDEGENMWNYIEYKEEELKILRRAMSYRLSEEPRNRITDAFFCVRKSTELLTYIYIMNFETSELAEQAFQEYSQYMQNQYDFEVNDEYRGRYFYREPYMGIKCDNNYSMYYKINYNDKMGVIYYVADTYLISIEFRIMLDSDYYQSFIDIIEGLDLPNPRTIPLLKHGVEPLNEKEQAFLNDIY